MAGDEGGFPDQHGCVNGVGHQARAEVTTAVPIVDGSARKQSSIILPHYICDTTTTASDV